MGRQKHSDSNCNNHDPKSKSLFHIIKHHPLCHHFIQKRHAYKKDGEERNDAGKYISTTHLYATYFIPKKKNLYGTLFYEIKCDLVACLKLFYTKEHMKFGH
jgi:hypothetical protein